jgi:hypothetical protein
MLKNVTVRGDGWWTRYCSGKFYSYNHVEFLPEDSYEVVADTTGNDIFNFDEPDLVDKKEGIE